MYRQTYCSGMYLFMRLVDFIVGLHGTLKGSDVGRGGKKAEKGRAAIHVGEGEPEHALSW